MVNETGSAASSGERAVELLAFRNSATVKGWLVGVASALPGVDTGEVHPAIQMSIKQNKEMDVSIKRAVRLGEEGVGAPEQGAVKRGNDITKSFTSAGAELPGRVQFCLLMGARVLVN